MRARTIARSGIALLIGAFCLVSAAAPASAWRVNALPVWSAPYPSGPWSFSLRVSNTGNLSMEVTDFEVWTNWGDPPSAVNPQHTSTTLPVVIGVGSSSDFEFSINVPAAAAGQREHLDAILTAANPNGSAWSNPVPGNFPGWNFTVLSSPQGSGSGGPPTFYWVVVIGLLATSITVRVFMMRRRRGPPTITGSPFQYPPQQPPPPPPPPV